MTILLYDYIELEDRASKHLRIWKAWHTIIYILAAVFGILNYTFLQNTKDVVDNNCVFYPRQLEFHWIEYTNTTNEEGYNNTKPIENVTAENNVTVNKDGIEAVNGTKSNNSTKLNDIITSDISNVTKNAQNGTPPSDISDKKEQRRKRKVDTQCYLDKIFIHSTKICTNNRGKREAHEYSTTVNETTVENKNVTLIYVNKTHRLVLDTSRTLFAKDNECQFAEYMPLLSTVFALVWATLFIMCPGGGHSRSGLQQPWRILTPALIFALVMVGLTGHSFTRTNGGLQAFCAAFHNYTNSTTCSSVDPFLEEAWNSTWGMGGRIATARGMSAGVWALWAVAATLLLVRCIAAPDFVVKRTGVYLTRDPQQKVMPYLQKNSRRSQRSTNSSPTKRDTVSVKSEPTITTELVTVSVEHEPESEPTSLSSSPVKMPLDKKDGEEAIEMAYNPKELRELR